MTTRTEVHEYWKNPWDGANLPEVYLEGAPRSEFLVKLIQRYVSNDRTILEIGCNVGRNLYYLWNAGYRRLSGVEISERALDLLRKQFPHMASESRICNAPIEEAIGSFKDTEFDVVFTMAVLEHIHTESEWIFPEIARITKELLVTIEDEHGESWRHFPRDYRPIFEPLGFVETEALQCTDVAGLGNDFMARLFHKRTCLP